MAPQLGAWIEKEGPLAAEMLAEWLNIGMTTPELGMVALAALAAGLIRGFTGFGSALVIAPVLSLLVGPRAAVPAIVIANMFTTAQLLPGAVRTVAWSRVVPLAIAGCLCVPLGAMLLITVDQDLMRRAISFLTVTFALLMLWGWRYTGKVKPAIAAGVGGAGGILSGAASIGGPPVIIFLLAGPDPAATNRATFIFYFLFTQLVGIAMYWSTALLDRRVGVLCIILMPSLVLGMWIGERMFNRASENMFRRVALVFLLGVGVATLVL